MVGGGWWCKGRAREGKENVTRSNGGRKKVRRVEFPGLTSGKLTREETRRHTSTLPVVPRMPCAILRLAVRRSSHRAKVPQPDQKLDSESDLCTEPP